MDWMCPDANSNISAVPPDDGMRLTLEQEFDLPCPGAKKIIVADQAVAKIKR